MLFSDKVHLVHVHLNNDLYICLGLYNMLRKHSAPMQASKPTKDDVI